MVKNTCDMKKTYVLRNGKMVLKGSAADEIRPLSIDPGHPHGIGGLYFDTDKDASYIPNLTQADYDNLASVMGGAQTNEFIENEVWAKLKRDQLPGGVTIPIPDYLEIEPGTAYYHYEKGKVNPNSTWRKDILDRAWEVQVAHASLLRVRSETTVSQPRPLSTNEVLDVQEYSFHPTPSRTDRIQELKKIRKASRNCVQSNVSGVYYIRRTL